MRPPWMRLMTSRPFPSRSFSMFLESARAPSSPGASARLWPELWSNFLIQGLFICFLLHAPAALGKQKMSPPCHRQSSSYTFSAAPPECWIDITNRGTIWSEKIKKKTLTEQLPTRDTIIIIYYPWRPLWAFKDEARMRQWFAVAAANNYIVLYLWTCPSLPRLCS